MRVADQSPVPIAGLSEAIQVWPREKCLRSIERPQGQIRVLFDTGAFEVVTIEVQPRSALEEPYLWEGMAIFVLSEGELVIEEEGGAHEVLHGDSIRLGKKVRFQLVNQQPYRALAYGLLFKEGEGPGSAPGK